MKQAKRHMLAPAAHVGKVKDRALATALLRVSEKTVNQEQNETDDVLYCGEEEPFYGWTNAVPNPRYSSGKKPKQTSKRKKSNKKNKKKANGGHSEIMWGMTGMTLTVVDQQNAYATLRDMYDNYKKSTQIDSLSKQNKITDPETYKYVPWEERISEREDDGGGRVKLPSMKGAPSSKLADVLEKYMNKRRNSLYSKMSKSEETAASVAASDMLTYYDRYKWNFTKENKQKSVAKAENKRKVEHIHLPTITSGKKNNLQPHVKEKLVRYVNGAVRNRRQHKLLHKNKKNAFYIKIYDGEETHDLPSMVKLEKKRARDNKNEDQTDRWVARVIIKEPDEAGSGWFKPYNDSESSSSVIIVPDTRWRRKLGVVEGERERIQKEMEKLRFQQQQQFKLNQMKKRLLHDNYDVDDNRYRLKQSQVHQQQKAPMFSVVEAAKVSIRHNELSKAKMAKTNSNDTKSTMHLPRVPAVNLNEASSSEETFKTKVLAGAPQVTQILPSSEDQTSSESADNNRPRNSRLFLKRGAARKSESRKTADKGKVRLPVLPKQAKLEQARISKKRKMKKEIATAEETVNKEKNETDEDNLLPLASEASESFRAALNDDDQDVTKMRLTQAVTKQKEKGNKKLLQNAEFFRYKVIPQPGYKSSSKKGNSNQKSIHPPHTKNKAQETIQEMIDHEKGALNSAINHINRKLGYANFLQEPVDGIETYKSALNSAIARAKMLEEHKHKQVPSNLTNMNRKGDVVMKRRVVPPILTTTSVTPNEPDPNHLPVVTNRSLSNGDDEMFQADVATTSQTINDKPTKRNRGRTTKRAKNSTSQTAAKSNKTAMFDDVVLSGDVIVQQRPTPKLLENSFAASITSVKPSRRVVNMIPQRTL